MNETFPETKRNESLIQLFWGVDNVSQKLSHKVAILCNTCCLCHQREFSASDLEHLYDQTLQRKVRQQEYKNNFPWGPLFITIYYVILLLVVANTGKIIRHLTVTQPTAQEWKGVPVTYLWVLQTFTLFQGNCTLVSITVNVPLLAKRLIFPFEFFLSDNTAK